MHQRLKHPAEQRRPPGARMEDICPAPRQPYVHQRTGRRIGDRVAQSLEHPVVIEENQGETHVHAPCDFTGRVEIGKEMRIDAGRQAPVVVHDAGAAVGEDEPAHDAEAHRRHRGKVLFDRGAARRDAEVRAPDIRAEVQPVVDRRAVGRPRVVAAVPVQGVDVVYLRC